jgi:phosphate transport system substrate-binding protein
MRINWRMTIALTAVLAVLGAACGESEPSASEEAPAGDLNTEPDGGSGGDTEAAMTEDETAAQTPSDAGGESGEDLSGTIAIDGSSTVGPLTTAIAEEYAAEQPDVGVEVGVSGTGGGFERFCGTGDTDISNASRPIQDEEVALCEENGIEFTEVRVGTDALTMVVNPENDWVSCLNNEQIEQIWGSDRATMWSGVDPSWPDEEITIFAPATTSGTYDFFNETVGIEEPTQDYSATENDNDIVRGVQGTPGGWGYFGFAFYTENQDALKALEYDAGEGCVAPSVETAQDDSYKLARPLFIYVKSESLSRPEVQDFAEFYLDTVNSVIEQVGYIAAPEDVIDEAKSTLQEAIEAT